MTEFIEEQKKAYSVAVMCRAFSVPQSGVYATRTRPPSARKKEDERLGKVIESEFIKRIGLPKGQFRVFGH